MKTMAKEMTRNYCGEVTMSPFDETEDLVFKTERPVGIT